MPHWHSPLYWTQIYLSAHTPETAAPKVIEALERYEKAYDAYYAFPRWRRVIGRITGFEPAERSALDDAMISLEVACVAALTGKA